MRACLIAILLGFIAAAALTLNAGRYDADPGVLTFLDRGGKIIGAVDLSHKGIRYWTPLEKIPNAIIEKTLRSEDRWFFWHRGINPLAVLKSAIQNIRSGRVVRGGSTITQQLSKDLIQERYGKISPRTLWNKARESLLAMGLEIKHDKRWIVEQYLNRIYYGRRAYGIAAAADIFFSKRLSELTLDEINALVQMPKAPGKASCAAHVSLQKAFGRHFMEYAAGTYHTGHNTLQNTAMLSTTLDSDLQRRIEEALRTKLSDRAIDDPKLTAAAVVIDVRTGDVLAMVGSRDYFDDEIDGQVNSAVALRQPGSALKPFTYFAAFAKGFLPNSIVPDVPLSFKAVGAEDEDAYAPQNFDRRYHGEMTMRDALANSYNVPAVVTLNEIGLSYYHWLLKRFGITTLNKPPPHYGLSVTLGSGEVTLLELTNAYAALARGGVFLPSRIWNDAPRTAPQPVVPRAKQFAAEVTNILSDPMARRKAFGFIEAMEVEGHRVAIKTGTSFEHRDNWAVGYTPAFAVGVWVGHADGSPMDPLKPSTGASGAAPIWHAVMEILLRGTTPQDFPGMQEVADNRIRPTMMRRDSNAVSLKLKPTSFGITNPVANAVYRIHSYLPIEHQMLRAEASAKQDISLDWYLDGEHIKTTKKNKAAVWIEPEFGRHKLRVEAANGDKQEVVFKVIEGEPI